MNADDEKIRLTDSTNPEQRIENTSHFFSKVSTRVFLFLLTLFLLIGLFLLNSPLRETESPATNLEEGEKKADEKETEDLTKGFFESFHNHKDEPMDCSLESFSRLTEGSYAYKTKLADCGGVKGNSIPVSSRFFKIYLVGEDLMSGGNQHLSGCPIGHPHGGGCPFFPKCSFASVKWIRDSHNADMIVISTQDANQIAHLQRPKKKAIRVLYQREPYWHPAHEDVQMDEFDLTMTGFVNAGIMNPVFLRRPMRFFSSQPIVEFVPFASRTGFALSIISICHTNSKRKEYLNHLTDYLGESRIHQYGKCGPLDLPPPPITNAAKVIANYKFFLAFENSLLTNYVSEKLLTVLTMPLIPVYRGGRRTLNVTTKPSFIDVSEFASPKELAIYLLYLDANPEEYAKYHEWRADPQPFSDQYLDLVAKQLPGQAEMLPYKNGQVATRHAACCRLCDPDIVKRAMEEHGPASIIPPRISGNEMNWFSFNGTFDTHSSGTLLAPEKDSLENEDDQEEEEFVEDENEDYDYAEDP